jgi:hypothetical protein
VQGVREGTATYYRVEPVDDEVDGEVGMREDRECAEDECEEARGPYPATVSAATAAVA